MRLRGTYVHAFLPTAQIVQAWMHFCTLSLICDSEVMHLTGMEAALPVASNCAGRQLAKLAGDPSRSGDALCERLVLVEVW